MRRAGIAIVVVAVVAGALLLRAGGGGSVRVAAIFDTANGVVAGEQVKIAGVVVGSVNQVELAPGPKARIVMNVKSRFAPFHRNATCTILPEGLISENFVECDPGSRQLARLPVGAGGVPTVPLVQTTVPASLQNLLNVFSLPTDDRLRVFIDELGIAGAGRGQDLNALLERSNPALVKARRALAIVAAQREQLATGIAQMERVLGALADKHPALREFVDRAATVARTTAAHRTALGQAVQRFPALLDAVRPGLESLDRAISHGTPLIAGLRVAAPALTTVTHTLPSFAEAATPALASLGSAARIGRGAVQTALPVVGDLQGAAAQAAPFATNLDRLLISSRDSGAIEGLMMVFYGFANVGAEYDQVSHQIALTVQAFPTCIADIHAPGCNGKYDAPGNGTIPPDNPACGPQADTPWAPITNCVSTVLPLRRPQAGTHPASPGVQPSGPSAGPVSRKPATSTPAPATPAPASSPPSALGPSSTTPVAPVGVTGAVSGAIGGLGNILHYLLGR